MWLLLARNHRKILPFVKTPACNSLPGCSRNSLLTSGALCHHWSDFPKRSKLSNRIFQPFCEYHCLVKNVNSRTKQSHLPFYDFQKGHLSPMSTWMMKSSRILHSVSKYGKEKVSKLNFHTSTWCRDIPDYLEGSVSEVDNVFDDFLREEFEENLDDDMTEEIQHFLNSRLLLYEETESSFMMPCHTCSSGDNTSRSQEIIIDKISGYYVCPWCCQAGTWEELCHMLDKREDTLTAHQLKTYFETASDISEDDYSVLEDSPLQAVSLSTLHSSGAKLSCDGTRVIFPLKGESGDIVGFESVSLLHNFPQIVRRYVTGEEKPLFVVDRGKTMQRMIVVPTCCDVLTLAEYEISSVSIPYHDLDVLCEYLNKWRKVVVWLGIGSPPRQLLQFLVNSQIPSWIVSCKENDSPIHSKSKYEVEEALKNIIPILSEETATFAELKHKIYHRLVNKEQTSGIQWKRFSELNNIMLGHRPGEMTVLTGPTGSGKTTLMAEYSLDLCAQGVVTLWGSFEISVVRLCEIMLQQYSGMPPPVELAEFNALASKFSYLPLHFLTYHGQQTTNSVLEAMSKAVRVWGIKHVIIDNLQFMLGTGDRPVDRWWEQDRAVSAFRSFATANNCHLTLIVHPKKIPEGQLLGIDSIFGGAKVTQEADNILILQVKQGNNINQTKKALQVVKNRYGGQLGIMPLKFHRESLTLSSHFSQKSKSKGKEKEKEKTKRMVNKVKGIEAFM